MFDPGKLYLATDPTLRNIAPASTMAHWRCEGRGPAYVKIGLESGLQGRRRARLDRGADRPPGRRLTGKERTRRRSSWPARASAGLMRNAQQVATVAITKGC